ncbi:MAG: hypothetical protein WDA18_00640 [Candidatus Ratteibacteria bacterium]
MTILSIELSHRPASIAISIEEKIAASLVWESEDPGKELFTAINAIVKMAKIDKKKISLFVPSLGPGSWTGIRLGMGAAIGMAEANMEKLYPVGSLDGIGYALRHNGKRAIIFSATEQKFHSAIFSSDRDALHTEPFATLNEEDTRIRLQGCKIVACADSSVEQTFLNSQRITLTIPPQAALNALLALRRKSLGIPPTLSPFYEK